MNNNKKKAILSIDGGGVRGILPVVILNYLEKKLQELSQNDQIRLADYFDFMAGTSTGSIIISALLAPDDNCRPRYTAEELIDLYKEESSVIFHSNLMREVKNISGFVGVKYGSEGLESVMEKYFDDTQLKDLLKPCVITSFDISRNKIQLFRQHRAKQEERYNFYVKDAARASASPMGYFPPVRIKDFSGESHCFIDGGIFAANPSLSAYAEMKRLHAGIETTDMLMLSLGTGKQAVQFGCQDTQNWGILEWLNPANHVMITALSEAPDGQLERIYNFGPEYLRINPDIDEEHISRIDNYEPSYLNYLIALGEEMVILHKAKLDEFATQLFNNGVSPIKEDEHLTNLLEEAVAEVPVHPAYIGFDTEMSYQELHTRSLKMAYYLADLNDTGTVAIMLPNLLAFPISLFGAWYADRTVTLINPLFTADEMVKQCQDAGVTTIIIAKLFLKTLQPILKDTTIKHVITVDVGDLQPSVKSSVINLVSFIKRPSLESLLGVGDSVETVEFMDIMDANLPEDANAMPRSNSIALLQYTGGTSGVLKAAILRHENLLANVDQLQSWLPPDLNHTSKILTALPLYHIFALTINCLMFIKLKGTSVMVVNPRDLKQLMAPFHKYSISIITGVNTLFNAVEQHEDFRKLDWSGLKVSVAGGMALQQTTAERWREVTGSNIVQGYGLTECSPVATAEPYDIDHFSGSVGPALPNTDILIIDKAHQPLPQGEIGEICIKGPQVMASYWHKPELNKEVFTDGGHFRTGDLGYLDEKGQLFIVGRVKELIIVSGFNVYPNDVEQVINQYPGVLESAAVGLDDEHSGQVVKAYVVTEKGAQIKSEDLIEHCTDHLAHYKVPKVIEWRSTLPKSNIGKILKRKLD